RIHLPQLRQRVLGHQPRAVGGPLQRGVVDDHQMPVPAHLHVQLDAVGAHLQRHLEGGHGVFRRVGRRAAVGVHLRHLPSAPAYFSLSMSAFTKQRCMTMMTTAGGSSAMMAAAMTRCHSGSWVPEGMSRWMPMTTTCMLRDVVIISGHRY